VGVALTSSKTSVEAYTAQLERLRGPRPSVRVVRPCTLGDGVETFGFDVERELLDRWAAARGRISSFIPASGAATRLWSSLASAPPELAARLRRAREEGLPKGLVPFHLYPDGTERTAVEEHVREAMELGGPTTRVHFTVGPESRTLFERELARLREHVAADALLELGLQDPATHTVAIDEKGELVHTPEGEVLTRPAGHGALLSNLAALGGDLVLIKNIDNICADPARPEVVLWRKRLVGALVALEERIHQVVRDIDQGKANELVCYEMLQRLKLKPPRGQAVIPFTRAQLARPLRVCGMVPNEGQRGGGPFWVRDEDGVTRRRIVEDVEIDQNYPGQEHIILASTHFNPVEIAASLRDPDGKPYDLDQYVDDKSWFVTTKEYQGRPIRVLERPGLWNGGMAGWTTVFVEMDPCVFQPVKSVTDLLAPAHDGCIAPIGSTGLSPREMRRLDEAVTGH
jgi:hypothetical protein